MCRDRRHRVISTSPVRVLLAALFLSASGAAIAQAPKKAGKRLDERATQSLFLNAPADDGLVAEKLLWKGYDLLAIANAAMAVRDPKGEFESTAEYDAKRARLIAQPVYGTVALQSRFALVVPELRKYPDYAAVGGAPLAYTFDADAKKLRLCWSGQEVVSGQLGRAVESIAAGNTKMTEGGAQNTYGAKVNKTSISGDHVTVAVSVAGGRCPVEMDMDGGTAQQLIRMAGAVVVGQLRSPFAEPDTQAKMATFSSPTEVLINVKRLLFVPEQIILLERDTRKVLVDRVAPF